MLLLTYIRIQLSTQQVIISIKLLPVIIVSTGQKQSEMAQTKKPLSQLAFDKIYRRIVSMEYRPGRTLEEKMLMSHLRIGRTPIREALQQLSMVCLVEHNPKKGYIVRQVMIQDIKPLLDALKILSSGVVDTICRKRETLSLREEKNWIQGMQKANCNLKTFLKRKKYFEIVQANHDFHISIAQGSRNKYIVRATQVIRCEVNRFAYLSFSSPVLRANTVQRHLEEVVAQHDGIIKACKHGNADQLNDEMTRHFASFKKRVIGLLIN